MRTPNQKHKGRNFLFWQHRKMKSIVGISSQRTTFHFTSWEKSDRINKVFLLLHSAQFCHCSWTPSALTLPALTKICYLKCVCMSSAFCGANTLNITRLFSARLSASTRNNKCRQGSIMRTVVSVMRWPHTTLNFKVSLSQLFQPSTKNIQSTTFGKKKKNSSKKFKLLIWTMSSSIYLNI